jgi:general secretion pathway protein G
VPKGGFTLVELLAVIAIIALVAGMLLTAAMKVREKNNRDATLSLIQRIELALEHYKTNNGQWPPDILNMPTEPGNRALARVLIEQDAVASRTSGSFGRAELEYESGNPNEPRILDVWGNMLLVRRNGFNRPDLDIWSPGPNGVCNRNDANPKDFGDDVVNWVRQ